MKNNENKDAPFHIQKINNNSLNKNVEENKSKSKETSIKSEVISTRAKNDNKDAKNYNNVTMKNSEDNKNISKEKVIKTEVVTVNTKIENIDVVNGKWSNCK